MKRPVLSLFLSLFVIASGSAQLRNSDVYKNPNVAKNSNERIEWRIPSIPGYLALKCDFHIHTVFSDGSVWPTYRVDEAWRDGLDAIAITDHLEVLRNKEYLKGDHNTSFDIAKKRGIENDFIVIKGTEITKDKPFGHMNALFIKDANKIDNEDPIAAIDEAIKQGAFIEWNHPGWPNDSTTLYDVHRKLISEKKIHGVEVVNEYEYYPRSFDWCNEFKLTFLSNSDVHGSIRQLYGLDTKTRPMTLVFAKEKSEEAIKEALFARRTIATFNHQLIGEESLLRSFVNECLRIKTRLNDKDKLVLEITNISDFNFTVQAEKIDYELLNGRTLKLTLPKGTSKLTLPNCWIGDFRYLEIPIK